MVFIRNLFTLFAAIAFSASAALADPALVRISDDDTTVWVFGTFHILPPEAEWRTAEVDDALADADAVYMEADVWSGGPQQMMGLVQQHGLMPPGEPLSSTMTGEEWQSVAAFSQSLGIPAQNLQPLRPWFAAITLAAQAAVSQGYDPNSGVDAQLYNELSTEGRELRFFETAEQQIRFLADLPMDIQTNLLVETALQGQSMPDQFDLMLAAWLVGDLEQIDAIGNAPLKEYSPETFAALMINRNREWAAELTELMHDEGVFFVAVGAAHLPGEEGVLALMEEQGFDVSDD